MKLSGEMKAKIKVKIVKWVLIALGAAVLILAFMEDPATFTVLGGICAGSILLMYWCAANVPYDDTYDIRGYRKKPFTKEELDYLHRACLGKSKKEQQRIIKNFRQIP